MPKFSNIFVLTTGRTGSKTFARACRHVTGFSAGHESRAFLVRDRVVYPRDHIEVDNRLSWFLGDLAKAYPSAAYVHLQRDEEKVADSYLRRWQAPVTVGRGWKQFVVMGGNDCHPIDACRQYVSATNENIRHFLRDKPHVNVSLESVNSDFERFWHWAELGPGLDDALAEWRVIDAR